MDIIINAKIKRLQCGALTAPVRIGRDGFIDGARGQEGDGKTPLGDYHLRFGLYRADRLPMPRTQLTVRETLIDDGWCDAPDDAAYNRFVKRPYGASTEALWHDDGAYDIVIIMSHNDSPPIAGLGSAIFIHITQPDDRATLGCIALTPDDMAALLPMLYGGQRVKIVV